MIVTQDVYNSPAGKVDLTSLGTMSVVLNGASATGTVNIDTGVTISTGSVTTNYLGNVLDWDDLKYIITGGGYPPYIRFIPTQPFPTNGCMISIYSEWEGTTLNTYNGMGEVALYARFSEDVAEVEDCRLLQYMGRPSGDSNYSSLVSGWMTPKDATSKSFIDHNIDLFSTERLSDKSWEDIKELRLVFKNKTTSKKCRIRNFYIYEAIRDAPSGEVTSYTSTSSTITANIQLQCIVGSTNTVAGICGYEVTVESLQDSVAKSGAWVTPVDSNTVVTLTDLPSTARSTFIQIIDTYGNTSYLNDSWGMLTKYVSLGSGSPELPHVDYNPDGLTVDLVYNVNGTGLSLTNYVLYEFGLNSLTSTNEFLPIVTDSDIVALPYSLIIPSLHIDADFKIKCTVQWSKTETLPDESSIVMTYYNEIEDILLTVDEDPPSIIGFTVSSAQSIVRLTVKAIDNRGVSKIEYIQINTDSSETLISTHSISNVIHEIENTFELSASPGDTLYFKVKVYDESENNSVSQVVSVLVISNSEFITDTANLNPSISASIEDNNNVVITWDSWEGVLGPVAGLFYTPKSFDIYRKIIGSNDPYICIAAEILSSNNSYIDYTILSTNDYSYVVVGNGDFNTTKSVSISIGKSEFTTTKYSHIESLLNTLPTWTAAVVKN